MQEEKEKEPVLRCQACGKAGKPFITAYDSTLDNHTPIQWDFCQHCATSMITRRLPAGVIRGMRREAGGFTEITQLRYYSKRGHVNNPLLTAKESGWLAPDGTFHPCEFGFHEKWAERNGMASKLMEAKGWLKHRVVGRTYMYSACVPKDRSLGQQLTEVLDTMCGGRPPRQVYRLAGIAPDPAPRSLRAETDRCPADNESPPSHSPNAP